MPRPRIQRIVAGQPIATVYKPAGVPARELAWTQLTLDEFEAIRLVDGEGLGQDTVAERMGVSRPTVTRIVASARSKIARVLINGQALQIQGGPVVQEPIARSFGRGGRCGRAWGGRSGRPGREGMRRGRSVGAPENQASRDAGSQQADQAESTRRQR